ncbi:MAG: helix-turn-helix domain-containing protein [Pseudomonadota bacterium]
MSPVLTQAIFAETVVRGGACALLLIMVARLVRPSSGSRIPALASVFAPGTIAYTIFRSSVYHVMDYPLILFLAVFSTLNTVFFWWLVIAMCSTQFHWTPIRLLPAAFMLALVFCRAIDLPVVDGDYDNLMYLLLILSMMGHAMFVSLSHYRDDPVDPKRLFQLLFVLVVGTTAIVSAALETYMLVTETQLRLFVLEGVVILILCLLCYPFVCGFAPALRLASPEGAVLAPERHEEEPAYMLNRVKALLKSGAYRESGLTVVQMADRLALPEYRLRRLVTRQLGYRNFNACLNAYRVDEARRILEDPTQLRRQIGLIADELGYGSVATFNRAFKEATGSTPSSFRKAAMAQKTDPQR